MSPTSVWVQPSLLTLHGQEGLLHHWSQYQGMSPAWLHGSTLTSLPCIPESSFTGKAEKGKKRQFGGFFFFFILFPLLSDSAAAAIVNDVLKMELLFSIGGKKPSLSWLPTGSTSHSEGSGWGGYLAVSSSSLMSKAWEFHKQIARQLHPTQVGDGRTNC